VLHLQLRVPVALADQVVELLCDDETVTNVAVVEGGYAKPPGTLVVADVAREGANPVVAALRSLGLHHEGSIMISEPATLLSDAAEDAERAAPGIPDDGIVWDIVENRVRKESVLSWAFLSFLTLATLIAGSGRLLDQPILIIGAMVVGPEFSPVAAICEIANPRPSAADRPSRPNATRFPLVFFVAVPRRVCACSAARTRRSNVWTAAANRSCCASLAPTCCIHCNCAAAFCRICWTSCLFVASAVRA